MKGRLCAPVTLSVGEVYPLVWRVGCAPTRGNRHHYGGGDESMHYWAPMLCCGQHLGTSPWVTCGGAPSVTLPSHRVLRDAPVMVVVHHADNLHLMILFCGWI